MAFVYDEKTRSAVDSQTGLSFGDGVDPMLRGDDLVAGRRNCKFGLKDASMKFLVVDRNTKVRSKYPKTGEEHLIDQPRVSYIIEDEIADALNIISRKSRIPVEELKKMMLDALYVYSTRGGIKPSLLDLVPEFEVKMVKNCHELPPEHHFYFPSKNVS